MHSVQINFSSFCGVFMKKPELHKEIGQRLKLIRHIIRDGSKISAREFGERFDETRDNIANYETGRAPVPIRLLHGLFYFGFNPIYLITGDGSFFAPNARGKELERKISLNKKINVYDPEALKAEILGETSPKKLPVYKVAAGAPKKSNKHVKAAPIVEEAPRRRGRPRLNEVAVAKPAAKVVKAMKPAAIEVVEEAPRRRGRPKLSETPIPMLRPHKKAAKIVKNKPVEKAVTKTVKPAPAPVVIEAPKRRGRPRLSEAPIALVRPAAKIAKAAKPAVKTIAKAMKQAPAPVVIEAPKRRGRPRLSEAPIAVVRPAAKAGKPVGRPALAKSSKPVGRPALAKSSKPVAKTAKPVVAPMVEEAPRRRGRPRLSEAPIAEVRPAAKTAKAAKPAPAKATKPAAKSKNQDTKRRGRPSLSEMAARAMAAVGMAPIQPPAKPVVMPDPMDTSNRKRYVEERQLAEARNKNRNKKNFKR